jgi:hypothetical protein
VTKQPTVTVREEVGAVFAHILHLTQELIEMVILEMWVVDDTVALWYEVIHESLQDLEGVEVFVVPAWSVIEHTTVCEVNIIISDLDKGPRQ